MSGYHVDWVGAVAAGVVAAIVFSLSKIAFPRLTGVSLYLVLGLRIWARQRPASTSSLDGIRRALK